MQLTKFEHSCLDITAPGGRIIIDPGIYSKSLTDLSAITALVITHVHGDHFDPEKVTAIIAANPDIQIFSTQEVADKIDAKVTVPELDHVYEVAGTTLEFFGGQHAFITDKPVAENYGVLLGNILYYPGDSLVSCPKPHSITAVPAQAPWLKFSEAADFVAADSASRIFLTHNAFLSEAGLALHDRLFGGAAEATGKELVTLQPGDSIEI